MKQRKIAGLCLFLVANIFGDQESELQRKKQVIEDITRYNQLGYMLGQMSKELLEDREKELHSIVMRLNQAFKACKKEDSCEESAELLESLFRDFVTASEILNNYKKEIENSDVAKEANALTEKYLHTISFGGSGAMQYQKDNPEWSRECAYANAKRLNAYKESEETAQYKDFLTKKELFDKCMLKNTDDCSLCKDLEDQKNAALEIAMATAEWQERMQREYEFLQIAAPIIRFGTVYHPYGDEEGKSE